MQPSPTVRKRRLASELRRLREAAGLTIEDVGEKLECSPSKISRIETLRVGVTPRDVRDMLLLYGVPEEQREYLVQIAREARIKGWWESFGDVGRGAFLGFEAEAAILRTYNAMLVPGLAQSEAYIRALIAEGAPDMSPDEAERRITMRLTRKRILERDDPPRVSFVLDESVLRRPVGGPDVMRTQLEHLVDLSTRPNVTFQVIPFAHRSYPGMGASFVIMEFPDPADRDVVYVEGTVDGTFQENADEVDYYSMLWGHLVAAGLSPKDSTAFIADAAGQFD
ncbi:MAG TPA: helix-turn-helix transcriptional regulator [Kutzneria sp.]|nr:helix-turn-helix transcriptional regulator [Kutzneria sp.]